MRKIVFIILVFSSALFAQSSTKASEALPKPPAEIDSLIQEAIFSEEIGDFDTADDIYREASEICPSCAEIYTNWAVMYDNKGVIDSAIALVSRAISAAPGYKDAYKLRGYYYFEMEQDEKSIADFKKILEIDSTETGLYFEIADTYEDWGKTKEAIEYYEKYLTLADEEEQKNYKDLMDKARERLAALKEKK